MKYAANRDYRRRRRLFLYPECLAIACCLEKCVYHYYSSLVPGSCFLEWLEGEYLRMNSLKQYRTTKDVIGADCGGNFNFNTMGMFQITPPIFSDLRPGCRRRE